MDDIDLGLMVVEFAPHEDGAVTMLLGIGPSCVTVTWNPDRLAADEHASAALSSVVGNLTKVMNHVLSEQVGGFLDLRTGA